MNPLFNPFVSLPLLKSYLFDPPRLRKSSIRDIERYKDKAFRRIVKYAYNVPLYHEKYKQHGISPNDIRGIKDIEKLPFISKEDLKNSFPDKLLPVGCNRKNSYTVCTGGTTGKPVCIYTDFFTIGKSSMIIIRELKELLHTARVRFAHLGNFTPRRIDLVVEKHFQPHIEFFNSSTTLNIDVSTPVEEIIQKLDDFKPDVIMSYPGIFQHLAYLKRRGYGSNIKPKLCWTGGAMLDDYTREYVEDAFRCKLLNIYPSVEAGADIAFECLNGSWHVHDDFFHLEVVNDEKEVLPLGEKGHIVLTRLWGRGTPIIRYTGMDDWISLSTNESCGCGLNSTILINGVEGRKRANIVLPDGRVFPPGAFCFITPVLIKLKTFKVKQYQIIQKKIDEIEILLVIDENLRNIGPSVETIKNEIRKAYELKVGSGVTINVREVSEIKHPKDSLKPPPIVVSHVNEREGYETIESKLKNKKV